MAPPKRKTGGGRVTPKASNTSPRHGDPDHNEVTASSRYTPKAVQGGRIPPNWIPVIMVALLVVGGLAIMARYLIWTDSNILTLIGLAMILAGLWAATKWE